MVEQVDMIDRVEVGRRVSPRLRVAFIHLQMIGELIVWERGRTNVALL